MQSPGLRRYLFNNLAADVARSLDARSYNQLKSYCSKLISESKLEALETAEQLMVALLDMDFISLKDISVLREQLEKVGAKEGVRLCRKYEEEVRELAEEAYSNGSRTDVPADASTVNNPRRVPLAMVENTSVIHQSHQVPDSSELNCRNTVDSNLSPGQDLFSLNNLESVRGPVENEYTTSFCLGQAQQTRDGGYVSARNPIVASPSESPGHHHNSQAASGSAAGVSSSSQCQPKAGCPLEVTPSAMVDSGGPQENSNLTEPCMESMVAAFENRLEISPLSSMPPDANLQSGYPAQDPSGWGRFENGATSQYSLQISNTTADFEERSDRQLAGTHLSLLIGPRLNEQVFVRNMMHSKRLKFTIALSTRHPLGEK
ncbi:uncharacterized protein LOC115463457 isoform X2 [Microcaecilia unicolor]|uniref:Uncharacterized protein LOC115463457 isoform X2 n=1 Tax=Microcaecilia unicolor TaxID=1415580 RepID=A0A6P7X2N7_9AMPH|nr:uncharacterized protein LOC115463457 isoform X2 [Microcaecilia unicolor]